MDVIVDLTEFIFCDGQPQKNDRRERNDEQIVQRWVTIRGCLTVIDLISNMSFSSICQKLFKFMYK